MSENEGKSLFEVFKKFRNDEDTRIFQLIRVGNSTGATDKKQAKVSISIPNDICNNKNRNLGELNKYIGIVMIIPKEKVEKFMKE